MAVRQGLRLRPVPVDGRGAVISAATVAEAMLLTPAHQFPLGVPLHPRRRDRLAAAVGRQGLHVTGIAAGLHAVVEFSRTSAELAALNRARDHGLTLDGLPAGDLLPVPYPRGNGEPAAPGHPYRGCEAPALYPGRLPARALRPAPFRRARPRWPCARCPGPAGSRPGEWWFATWQVQRKVWPLSQGAGITVGEVESGVQAGIPDLRGVVRPGINLTSAGLSNGDTDIQAGEDGHGTAMAVMIAGQGRGTGTVGIAPRAQILPVTVGGSGPRSVASRCDPVLQAAVAYALGRDVVLIASSG